jgi:hypothetical protein
MEAPPLIRRTFCRCIARIVKCRKVETLAEHEYIGDDIAAANCIGLIVAARTWRLHARGKMRGCVSRLKDDSRRLCLPGAPPLPGWSSWPWPARRLAIFIGADNST